MHDQTKATIPTIIVVFGATGDLIQKKIAPSLFNLYEAGRLPQFFKIVGVSHRELDNQGFKNHIKAILKKRKISDRNPKVKKYLSCLSYVQGDFTKMDTYKNLAEKLQKIDDEKKICTNKLFYLAVPPKYYDVIFKNLAKSGLTKPCSVEEGWSRVLVEKPFGDDLKTAKQLEETLHKLFREEQIYRIDHYLAKSMLQNIMAVRFVNNIFEQLFNSKFIESVELTLLEKKGVEDRGAFYDNVGTLRDVGQNHLLQMLALIAMNQPSSLSASAIRPLRAQVLKALKRPSALEIKKNTFRAQYIGYHKIKGVKPGSKTETYFKIKTYLEHPRWQGVPITLESGKRMKAPKKQIALNIRHSVPCLCPPGMEHFRNKIIFDLAPEEGMTMEFWAKKPGLDWKIERRELSHTYRKDSKSNQYTEEYEKLLFDSIIGDQTLFVSSEEIFAMWKYIDPIEAAWKKNAVKLEKYKPGTNDILKKASRIDRVDAMPLVKGMPRHIGIIGLGKMGGGLAQQLLDKGWKVSGLNRSPATTKKLAKKGLIPTYSAKELIDSLPSPKVVWVMVPAGKPVDDVLFGKEGLSKLLKRGDYIVDGGNSFFQNTVKRGKKITKIGIHYLDAGVSGGPEGARHGASIMVGGKKSEYNYLAPLFADLVVYHGVEHFEGLGAGHFVKMVHNGIEYGMMQAIAEGFGILKRSDYRLHLRKIASVYNHGSVIESNLIEWMYDAFELFGDNLKGVSGKAKQSGEGLWTSHAAHTMGVPDKIIHEAVRARERSEKKPNYQGKVIMALRNQFGGHSIKGD